MKPENTSKRPTEEHLLIPMLTLKLWGISGTWRPAAKASWSTPMYDMWSYVVDAGGNETPTTRPPPARPDGSSAVDLE